MYKRIVTNQGYISITNSDDVLITFEEERIITKGGFFFLDDKHTLLKINICSGEHKLTLIYSKYVDKSGLNEKDRDEDYKLILKFLANNDLELHFEIQKINSIEQDIKIKRYENE